MVVDQCWMVLNSRVLLLDFASPEGFAATPPLMMMGLDVRAELPLDEASARIGGSGIILFHAVHRTCGLLQSRLAAARHEFPAAPVCIVTGFDPGSVSRRDAIMADYGDARAFLQATGVCFLSIEPDAARATSHAESRMDDQHANAGPTGW